MRYSSPESAAPRPGGAIPSDSSAIGSHTEKASCTSATSIILAVVPAMAYAALAASPAEGIWWYEPPAPNPAEDVYCESPLIHTGASVMRRQVGPSATRTAAEPEHSREQSSTFRSSVTGGEASTSDIVQGEPYSECGLSWAWERFFAGTAAKSSRDTPYRRMYDLVSMDPQYMGLRNCPRDTSQSSTEPGLPGFSAPATRTVLARPDRT